MADITPVQLNPRGKSEEFGVELVCPICDDVVYVKTGAYMQFSAGHICPEITEEDFNG